MFVKMIIDLAGGNAIDNLHVNRSRTSCFIPAKVRFKVDMLQQRQSSLNSRVALENAFIIVQPIANYLQVMLVSSVLGN